MWLLEGRSGSFSPCPSPSSHRYLQQKNTWASGIKLPRQRVLWSGPAVLRGRWSFSILCVILLYEFWCWRNRYVSRTVIKSHLFCFAFCTSLFGLQLFLVLCKSTSEGKDVRWRSFCTRSLGGMQLCRFIPPPSLRFSSRKEKRLETFTVSAHS